jgi:hypothetical protein
MSSALSVDRPVQQDIKIEYFAAQKQIIITDSVQIKRTLTSKHDGVKQALMILFHVSLRTLRQYL